MLGKCLEKCLENYISKDAMKPNFEMVGIPNLPTNKISSKFEYNLMDNNVEYYDQQLGAVHPRLSHIEIKGIKICTIILISIMNIWMVASSNGTGDRVVYSSDKYQKNKGNCTTIRTNNVNAIVM